jgi:SAM-dependent methyltransferase
MKKRASCVTLLERDLRDGRWTRGFRNKIDAVVSATALHWLTKPQLSAFYKSMSAVLKPDGVFLNADHAGSGNACVREYWDKSKRKLRGKGSRDTDWEAFWNDYLSALGDHSKSRRERVLGRYEGVEDGLPLPWHLESLSKLTFTDVDCYYRFFGDAIVGGRKI